MDLSLKIKKINKFNEYILLDNKSKKEYNLVLEFYGMKTPKVNDVLLLNANLVDPKSKWYSQPYAFEPLGSDDLDLNESDMAGLVTKDKKYVLKRIYGWYGKGFKMD